MARFVITGGLGVGKTSVLSILKPRYQTVAEPARELIAEHRDTSGDTTLDHRPERFVEILITRSIEKYTAASPSAVTVFDRGVPDCIVYAMAYELDIGPALDAASRYPYENSVFVDLPIDVVCIPRPGCSGAMPESRLQQYAAGRMQQDTEG
jgi:predicted ATPase